MREHRVIDAALDELIAALAAGADYRPAWIAARELLRQHYSAESAFLEELRPHMPGLTAKITAQHEEVLEIGDCLQQALDAQQSGDALRLARRFHAIAQHNVIEEERDVFPVAARCFEF